MKTRTVAELKQLNKELIRHEIQRLDICTKAIIAKNTSLSNTTCSTLINEMERDGEILYVDQETQPVGRPINQYRYNPDYLHVCGLAVEMIEPEDGGGHFGQGAVIRYAVADAFGRVIAEQETTEKPFRAEMICETLNALKQKDPLIRAAITGIPGIITDGVVEFCDVAELTGVRLPELLADRVHMPCAVYNDMSGMAIGAWQMSGRKEEALAVLFFPKKLPVKVGAGYMINGRLLKGSTNMSGEMPLVFRGMNISPDNSDWLRDDAFADYTAKLILSITAVLDPAQIILCGHADENRHGEKIRAACREILTDRHMPEIIISDMHQKMYMDGMIQALRERELFPLMTEDRIR